MNFFLLIDCIAVVEILAIHRQQALRPDHGRHRFERIRFARIVLKTVRVLFTSGYVELVDVSNFVLSLKSDDVVREIFALKKVRAIQVAVVRGWILASWLR